MQMVNIYITLIFSMKQTKFDEAKHEKLSGRMQTAYKAEVSKYKADIADGKIDAPAFKEKEVTKKKEKFEIKHNENKETEQMRLI